MEEATGYVANLLGGWKLTISASAGETIAWLQHDGLDLDRLGYVPTVYHDGGETPPLVLFHAAQPDRAPYIWEPKSGRVYQAGAPASSGGE